MSLFEGRRLTLGSESLTDKPPPVKLCISSEMLLFLSQFPGLPPADSSAVSLSKSRVLTSSVISIGSALTSFVPLMVSAFSVLLIHFQRPFSFSELVSFSKSVGPFSTSLITLTLVILSPSTPGIIISN